MMEGWLLGVRVVAALTCLLLVACDFSLENNQLGVLKDRRDRIHILYVGCKGRDERILSVEIIRVRGTLGGNDDTIVWRVEASEDVNQIDVVVGESSVAFDETVPLTEQLRGTYTVVVSTSVDTGMPQGVDVDSVTQGMVDSGSGGLMSERAFRDIAAESCR